MQRRSFLNYFLGASLTAFGGVALYTGGLYLVPPGAFSAETEGGEIVRFALSDLPVGSAKMFRYKGEPSVAIRVTEKDIRALSAVCTHLGCIVKWDAAKQQLVCPCHVAAFDVNGNVIGGPAPSPLQSMSARIAQDEIIIGDA
jgi:cytochrome b6-f complex iron-sulfur subunit